MFCLLFVSTNFYQSLPAEIQFLEGSLGLNTTTEVRRFALQEFCPEAGISPEELRFRVRSVICGLEQLPSKSYHQIKVEPINNKIHKINKNHHAVQFKIVRALKEVGLPLVTWDL